MCGVEYVQAPVPMSLAKARHSRLLSNALSTRPLRPMPGAKLLAWWYVEATCGPVDHVHSIYMRSAYPPAQKHMARRPLTVWIPARQGFDQRVLRDAS